MPCRTVGFGRLEARKEPRTRWVPRLRHTATLGGQWQERRGGDEDLTPFRRADATVAHKFLSGRRGHSSLPQHGPRDRRPRAREPVTSMASRHHLTCLVPDAAFHVLLEPELHQNPHMENEWEKKKECSFCHRYTCRGIWKTYFGCHPLRNRYTLCVLTYTIDHLRSKATDDQSEVFIIFILVLLLL